MDHMGLPLPVTRQDGGFLLVDGGLSRQYYDPSLYLTYQEYASPPLQRKSKKSWGERLRFGRGKDKDKETVRQRNYLQEYKDKYGSMSGGSALSKSMRYADPWLQNIDGSMSVRPGRSRSRLVSPTGNLVYPAWKGYDKTCVCDDYLSGRERRKKGQKKCKKCGGSRTAAANLYDFGEQQHVYEEFRFGPQQVPRSRSKSCSPTRLATPDLIRHQPEMRTQQTTKVYIPASQEDDETESVSTTTSEESRSWNNSKSILEYDFSAYDLITKYLRKKQQVEGEPEEDNSLDDVDDLSDELSDNVLEEEATPTVVTVNGVAPEAPGLRISGQRIRIFSSGGQKSVDEDSSEYPSSNFDISEEYASLNSSFTSSQCTFQSMTLLDSPPRAKPQPPRPPRKTRIRIDGPHTSRTIINEQSIKSILKKPDDAEPDFFLPTFQEFRLRKKKQVHFRSSHDITVLDDVAVQQLEEEVVAAEASSTEIPTQHVAEEKDDAPTDEISEDQNDTSAHEPTVESLEYKELCSDDVEKDMSLDVIDVVAPQDVPTAPMALPEDIEDDELFVEISVEDPVGGLNEVDETQEETISNDEEESPSCFPLEPTTNVDDNQVDILTENVQDLEQVEEMVLESENCISSTPVDSALEEPQHSESYNDVRKSEDSPVCDKEDDVQSVSEPDSVLNFQCTAPNSTQTVLNLECAVQESPHLEMLPDSDSFASDAETPSSVVNTQLHLVQSDEKPKMAEEILQGNSEETEEDKTLEKELQFSKLLYQKFGAKQPEGKGHLFNDTTRIRMQRQRPSALGVFLQDMISDNPAGHRESRAGKNSRRVNLKRQRLTSSFRLPSPTRPKEPPPPPPPPSGQRRTGGRVSDVSKKPQLLESIPDIHPSRHDSSSVGKVSPMTTLAEQSPRPAASPTTEQTVPSPLLKINYTTPPPKVPPPPPPRKFFPFTEKQIRDINSGVVPKRKLSGILGRGDPQTYQNIYFATKPLIPPHSSSSPQLSCGTQEDQLPADRRLSSVITTDDVTKSPSPSIVTHQQKNSRNAAEFMTSTFSSLSDGSITATYENFSAVQTSNIYDPVADDPPPKVPARRNRRSSMTEKPVVPPPKIPFTPPSLPNLSKLSKLSKSFFTPHEYEYPEVLPSKMNPSSELKKSPFSKTLTSTLFSKQAGFSPASSPLPPLPPASRSKFYLPTDDEESIYEQIKDHIYEELPDYDDVNLRTRSPSPPRKSIFEGASKYEILNYLEGARERGLNMDDPDDSEELLSGRPCLDRNNGNRVSNMSNVSDSSEDSSVLLPGDDKKDHRPSAEVERNDSGVGSETSKPVSIRRRVDDVEEQLCEDCDQTVETQVTDSGVMFDPLVCRKCSKKRSERKEIITEIIETEIKYGRDLKIMYEEFYKPMLVAGLLSPDQLSSIFINIEELMVVNVRFTEKLKDALEIALEQGDEDLCTVNIGSIFLQSTPMLHAFENYCTKQGAASNLLAAMEKERELLRIFLKVSQMENPVLRRMNLSSFLMVPVQRVTKYPLLLARLYKVTPHQQAGRAVLQEAQQKIELHLEHMNAEAKDVTTTKLWRRISMINTPPYRRVPGTSESDMGNIRIRKMALDVLEWDREESRFVIEGRLLYTQPADNNWLKGRALKMSSVNALLVTLGRPTATYRPDVGCDNLFFPRETGIREATLLLVREKNSRYSLLREPLSLDKCVVCWEPDWEDCFELQEFHTKDSYIFKSEDNNQTLNWYRQLRYHSINLGTWRRRRNALANIMINGMNRS